MPTIGSFSDSEVKKGTEAETKSHFRFLFDQYAWFLREGSTNRMYFAYGLNVRGTSVDDYIGKSSFLKIKSMAERALAVRAGSIGFDYSVTIKDKFNATSSVVCQ